MDQAMVDLITRNAAGGFTGLGPIPQRLMANGMDIGALRPWVNPADGRSYVTINGAAVPLITNATLRKDEWKQYDTAVIKAAQQRLGGVQDLISRGLTYSIGNGLGKTVLEYEDQSDITDAHMSMDAVTRGQNDRPEWDLNYLPLPIIHKDFQINIRALNASRTTGMSLDTTMAELATFKVAEKVETILFQGASSFTYGGGTIRGYVDFDHRTTGSGTAWTDSAKTGKQIIEDVVAMKAASISDRHYGPWMLYIPTAYETVLDEDYQTGYPKTIRSRILEIDGILGVRVVDKLASTAILLVQMTPDTVRMVIGMPITMLEWVSEGGMVFHYKIMTIQVPQLRADQNDRSGIVHWTMS
jgi:uncharacterized linocin/CFP29 family protein